MVANPMMQHDPFPNIPFELKNIVAWCVWQYQITPYGKTKVPRNPISYTHKADSTDPSTWVSYDVAVANLSGYEGLGFFFSKSAGYTGVDLDDPFSRKDKSVISPGDPDYEAAAKTSEQHGNIYNACKSYAELSPSGKGAHIIVKGSIPRGVKSPAKKVEMYDSARFFTMTGQSIRLVGIYEEQEFLDNLFASIGKLKDAEGFDPADKPEIDDDETIYNRASNAVNGEKFLKLWAGDSTGYASESEAHQALMNIIAFYTDNFAQCKRMFMFSKMSSHPKATRKGYLDASIRKAFDQKPPTIEALTNMSNDFQKLLERQRLNSTSKEAAGNATVAVCAQPAAQEQEGKGNNPPALKSNKRFTPPKASREWALNPPPGLLRDVAGFIYEQARLPVEEIAVAGSLAFLAGICGRAFNVSGTGLNIYLTLLAESGRGKEAMAGGIDKLIASMMMSNPMCEQIVGPAVISSGQALFPFIQNNSKSFVSVLTEFNGMLAQMTARVPNSAQAALNANLLSFYSKSGVGSVVRPAIFADANKNSKSLLSPAVTLLGECTITHMKTTVTPEMVTSGLLPRFVNIVYDGERVVDNENAKRAPSLELVQRLVKLFNAASQLNAGNRVVDIGIDDEAGEYLNSVNNYLRARMNDPEHKQYNELWNRVYLNILKIAAICSVEMEGDNPKFNSKIGIVQAEWATELVFNSANWWIASFGQHEIGEQNNDIAQRRDIRKQIKRFFSLPTDVQLKYRATEEMVKDWIVPYRYLISSTTSFASFKNLERQGGHAGALKRALAAMIDAGEIEEASKASNYATKYNNKALAYRVVAME